MKHARLEVYRHLFRSVAEEMGATLMRSAYSPNIKERCDYSCAVFDSDGAMIEQAAHIPVHLGSTPMSVAAAIDAFPDLRASDPPVVLNDPYAGGTHLPDITVVSPVFDGAGERRFWVANRAHHSDVGGITPGSLPLSKHIDDEGIRISPCLLDERMVQTIASASRTPHERVGDLQAQLAANRRGIQRLRELLKKDETLGAAQGLIAYSERVMREVLSDLPDGIWSSEDILDGDGHGSGPIALRCTLAVSGGSAVVDFTTSADQVTGPVNVPRAVTVSAVLYVFRCIAPDELPSNAGYMRCIDVVTRAGSVLDAEYPSPVAIGNVETSQRVVDVVFRALAQAIPDQIPAASCGSMNNVTIGGIDPRSGAPFAYYETIGGGSGAAKGFRGESAVHTHMTNTLNTPVEALEHAYPFRVMRYGVRRGSGGPGEWGGGDGVIRRYAFDSDATVTLMTERRASSPWGLDGGNPGQHGTNTLKRDGAESEMPAKTTFEVGAGDEVELATPGGGGFGSPGRADTHRIGRDPD